MTAATLKIEDLGSGEKRVVVDCAHGTTTGHAMNADAIEEAALVAGLVMKHYAEEGCGCTRELRRKYPPSLLPKTLWVGAGRP